MSAQVVAAINAVLAQQGLLLKSGTVVDATPIAVPSATQKRLGRAQPGDEPEQEGQAVVIRHEGKHRYGCRLGPGAHRAGTASSLIDVVEANRLLHGQETEA